LVISQDGLSEETSYSLTMDLDINYDDNSVTNRTTLEFRTSSVVEGGSIEVSPATGVYMTESFVFELEGWNSLYEPFFYRLVAGY